MRDDLALLAIFVILGVVLVTLLSFRREFIKFLRRFKP